jgi:anti-sigma factor RsiW
MHCEQVRQLFDAYVDGELSASQRTELGAHRLQCADCRRELALLEVSGHVLATDGMPEETSADFTDRLLACIDSPRRRWTQRIRRGLYIGGPMAAAAVVGLAFLGVFDRRESRVLGHKVERVAAPPAALPDHAVETPFSDLTQPAEGDAADRPTSEFFRRLRENVDAMEKLNATTLQLLESLQRPSPDRDSTESSGGDFVGPPAPDESVDSDIEDF